MNKRQAKMVAIDCAIYLLESSSVVEILADEPDWTDQDIEKIERELVAIEDSLRKRLERLEDTT